MRRRITYKNIFGIGFAVPVFSLAVLCKANAQECAALPSCEEFGYLYTAEECAGQKYVKCPFDQTKYFCLEDNNSGGNCTNPQVGDILYSDMSCSADVVSGKSPIAVVLHPEKRLAIALKTELKSWTEGYCDVSELKNYSNADDAQADWDGKSNTNIGVNYCKTNCSGGCPAFEYVNTYKTDGTNAGDWYFPSLGELHQIYYEKTKLNNALAKVDGMQIPDNNHWSSSKNYSNAWLHSFGSGSIDSLIKQGIRNGGRGYVRPFLAF